MWDRRLASDPSIQDECASEQILSTTADCCLAVRDYNDRPTRMKF